MRKHTKRLLAFLLTLAMLVSLVNVQQFSVTAEAPETKTEVSQTETFTGTDTKAKQKSVEAENGKTDKASLSQTDTDAKKQEPAREQKEETGDSESSDDVQKQDAEENSESDETDRTDQSDADDADDDSSQNGDKDDQKDDAGTKDEQEDEDSKDEETEGEDATEGNNKTDNTSEQKDRPSQGNNSNQITVTDQTDSDKSESSDTQNEDDKNKSPNDQNEDNTNAVITDDKSDGTKNETDTEQDKDETDTEQDEKQDESDTDNTLTYEQTARKALARIGAAEAFAEDNVIENAEDYFDIVNEDGEKIPAAPTNFSLTTGDTFADSVPEIEGYDFVNATFNGIAVESIGELTYDGRTYIYYTTADSSTSLAAMVLGEGEKINLNYEQYREPYSITYTLTGNTDGVNAEEVFGTDKPDEVKNGDSYAFRVTIPRGYEADILVNNVLQGKLGVEPAYVENGDVITADTSNDKPVELTLSGIYEINNVDSNQTVAVNLTKRNSYNFSAVLWTQTKYASDGSTPRADFGDKTSTFNGVSENSTNELWEFTTRTTASDGSGRTWILDSLQVNGTKLNIPYGDYSTDWWGDPNFSPVSAVTELPSGTVVTVTLENINRRWGAGEYFYSRTYSVSVSNCYEDITITGGNLNASGWTEIIPDRLTGVEFQIYDRQTGTDTTNTWKMMEQSEPFGVGSDDTSKNYWFGNNELRYRLLPGYVNPVVKYGTASGIDNNNLGNFIGSTHGPNEDGWYTFSINGQNGNNITMLRIEASIGSYDVSYDGNLPNDFKSEDLENLPESDDGNYNIVDNGQIIVSSMIPTDKNNKYVFDYWTLNGYVDSSGKPIEIHPNQVLDLEHVLETIGNQMTGEVLTLQAHWTEIGKADTITYHIQFILEDENGNVMQTINQGSYQAPTGSTIILDTESDVIKEFLNTHQEYVLNGTKTDRYNSNVQNGETLIVYFTKAVTDVTLTKNVTGNMGEKNKSFNFELSIGGEEKTGVFLKDKEKTTFEEEKIGDTIRFKEKNADGYTVTVSFVDEDNTTQDGTIEVGEDGYYSLQVTKGLNITVTNHKQINSPTGLSGGSDSWMILLGAAAVLAVSTGLYGLRRRKTGAHD